jgi:membrane protein insertase Oxa1/YidC/SpoIIIJ
MNRWFNPSHPQTLQAAVILGYLSAVFGLLNPATYFMLVLFIGLGIGAFGSANNKRWGYFLLAGCSLLVALFWISRFVASLGSSIVVTLILLNALVFPVALAVAALHPHSREYQKVWFE